MATTIVLEMGPCTCVCGLPVRMPESVCTGCQRDAGGCICATYRNDPRRWLAQYAHRMGKAA